MINFIIVLALIKIVAVIAFFKNPLWLAKKIIGLLAKPYYKIISSGAHNIPKEGGALLLSNHQSFVDWIFIQLVVNRRIRFVIEKEYYNKPQFKWLLNHFGVIPIEPNSAKGTIETLAELIEEGELVLIFPEGQLTKNGGLSEVKRGYQILQRRAKARVIPIGIQGLWGSRFSYASSSFQKVSKVTSRRIVTVFFGECSEGNFPIRKFISSVQVLNAKAGIKISKDIPPPHLAWLRVSKSYPKDLALIDHDGRRITQRELLIAVNIFKKSILEVTGQQRVGILLPPTLGATITMFATFAGGKSIVPLNFTASPNSFQSFISRSHIDVIFTSRRFLDRLSKRSIHIERLVKKVNEFNKSKARRDVRLIYLEDVKSSIGTKDKLGAAIKSLLPMIIIRKILWKRINNENEAALIFSSGSEGIPKGVPLSHRNLTFNAIQCASLLNKHENDKIISSLPLFHSFGITATTILPLIQGIPMICSPDPTDGYELAKNLEQFGGTVLFATSTFLGIYARNSKVNKSSFSSLRLVVSGGEKQNNDIRKIFEEKFEKKIYEGYGTTECSPVVAVNLPPKSGKNPNANYSGNVLGSIGMPLPYTAVDLIDRESGQQLKDGLSGELVIAGPQVMSGYLDNNPNRDVCLFNSNGLSWYRTGDKAEIDEKGYVFIKDRYSRFAKIGGEMISLQAAEEFIQTILQSNVDISSQEIDIYVIAIEDSKKGELLVGLAHKSLSSHDIRSALIKSEIHKFYIPNKIIYVEDLPKLGTGKADYSRAKEIVKEKLTATY